MVVLFCPRLMVKSFPLCEFILQLKWRFGKDQSFRSLAVHLIAISAEFDRIRTSTFIVLACKDNLPIADFETYLKNASSGKVTSAVVPETYVKDFMKRSYSVVLRDDYAPVDNLIAPVFEERFGYKRKDR